MAILLLSEIRTLALNRLQANVSTDAPVTTAQLDEQINDSYSELWEVAGASTKKSTHATLWTPSPAVAGTLALAGQVSNFKELLRVYLSGTVGSVGQTAGDVELDRMEMAELMYRRRTSDLYGNTVAYAVERLEPDAAADIGKITIQLWPAASATQYFPAHYVRNRTTLVNASDVPDVTEGESRDIALMAAMKLAPLVGRQELVPGIIADITQKTRSALDSKFRALLEPRRKPDEVTA